MRTSRKRYVFAYKGVGTVRLDAGVIEVGAQRWQVAGDSSERRAAFEMMEKARAELAEHPPARPKFKGLRATREEIATRTQQLRAERSLMTEEQKRVERQTAVVAARTRWSWPLLDQATATGAQGRVVGEFTGGALCWSGRAYTLERRGSPPETWSVRLSFMREPVVYALSAGARELATFTNHCELAVDDAAAIDPELLLFASYVVLRQRSWAPRDSGGGGGGG